MRAATRCAPLSLPGTPSIDNYEATPIAVLINFVIIPLRAQRNSPKRRKETTKNKTNQHTRMLHSKSPKRRGK